ncbi:MAG: hypothetical protein Q7R64_01235 [bacterium]|nr:hypothetical protein [bacterium]
MAKNILHDIMTKEHRTIREVPLPRGRKHIDAVEEDSVLYEREEIELQEESSPLPWRKVLLWGAVVFFALILVVAFIASFSGATVSVLARSESITVHHEFTASKDGAKLRFQTLPINETAEVVIPADTSKKVLEKSKGTIVIYNNFSDKPQRLIRNTRFETPAGLIYRIDSSVTVPGRTLKDGKKVPGSIEATVFADSPGAEYNIPLSDFTIPGFKSDPARFSTFYARSKTPMTGGFEGIQHIPSESALVTARASLQKTLADKVTAKTSTFVLPEFILFPSALVTRSSSLAPEEREGGLSAVREKMTGTAYLFKREDLARAVASASLPTLSNLPIEMPDLGSLRFAFKEVPVGESAEVKSIRFTLDGSAKVVWLFDGEKLRDALAGKPKGELLKTLSSFPTVEKAELVIRPFWSRTFPNNPKKITVEEVHELSGNPAQ